jgi:hypothetical protein
MAQKTILNESEIRRFMRLASLAPLAENGFNKFAAAAGIEEEEVEDEFEASEDEMGLEEPVDAIPEPGLDDVDVSDEVPMDDMDAMDAAPGGDVEDQFMDLVRQLADLVGVEVDMDDGGEELGAGDVGVEDDLESGDEGGDDEFEVAMSPEEDEEGLGSVDMMDPEEEDDEPGNRYMQEANSDKIVAEVARRVAKRLQKEKGRNDIAEKLAERIFNRLSTK